MAGIEKVCEYSGEYPSWLMYGYKRNHIQIMPKYRPEFRGKDHTLYIFQPEIILSGKYSYSTWDEWAAEDMDNWIPPFTSPKEYAKYFGKRLINSYDFILHVPDMQGEVKGLYVNSTQDISATKRRLKRMLRCRKLNIIRVNSDMNSWLSEHRKNNP